MELSGENLTGGGGGATLCWMKFPLMSVLWGEGFNRGWARFTDIIWKWAEIIPLMNGWHLLNTLLFYFVFTALYAKVWLCVRSFLRAATETWVVQSEQEVFFKIAKSFSIKRKVLRTKQPILYGTNLPKTICKFRIYIFHLQWAKFELPLVAERKTFRN